MQSDLITTVIVEDEPSASQNLQNLLAKHSPAVAIVATCKDVQEGISAINEYKPQLVILDIQLGTQSSFEILERVDHTDFKIIFVTAYNEYAVRAFQFSAVDYVVKPIHPERLQQAVQKVSDQITAKNMSSMMQVLMENMSGNQPRLKKIVLSTSDMVHVVEIANIVKCQSSGNYTVFHFSNQKPLVISRTLKEFDAQLSDSGFFRVHRSWLINESHIAGYDKREGGFVVMSDHSKLPVSPKKRDQLLTLIREKN